MKSEPPLLKEVKKIEQGGKEAIRKNLLEHAVLKAQLLASKKMCTKKSGK